MGGFYRFQMTEMLEISDELKGLFPEGHTFDQVMAMDGKIYRAKEGRRTLLFKVGEKEYFAKIHSGIGWGEIWKNLSRFRLPVIDASNEWKAVDLLESVGVETVEIVAKGVRGNNPAKRESFVIMKALEERLELEDFLKDMGGLTGESRRRLRKFLVEKIADSSRRMHRAGMNHRDFYLCHFHIIERDWSDEGVAKMEENGFKDIRLPLIDLHRSQIRKAVPMRWLAKDLGALLFSAIDCDLTNRDIVRFLRVYLGEDWRESLKNERRLWQTVLRRARKFYQKHRGKEPQFPRVLTSK